MRIAVLSDIHANMHALQAVWDDLSRLEVDAIYCLGDLVGYGAFPNDVIEFVSRNRILTIMGNYDEAVGYDMHESGTLPRSAQQDRLDRISLAWTRETTTSKKKGYLQSLPLNRREAHRKLRMVFVHGSPRRINEYLYPDLPQATFKAMARLADCDVLFTGHTHMPMVKRIERTWMINPGSVGMPQDGDARASYALLTRGLRLDIVIRRVAYDTKAASDAVIRAGLPDALAHYLTRGQLVRARTDMLEGEKTG